jgi:hypothetical protein
MFRIASSLAAAALLLAACGGGASSPVGAGPPGSQSGGTDSKSAKLTVSPTTLNFSAVGAAAAQPFTATAQGHATLTAISSNPLVATVDPASATTSDGQAKSATFTVTPLASGISTVTIADKQGDTATVAVSVTAAPGPLKISTTGVTICPSSGLSACSDSAQTIQVTQANFTGPFVESDDCDPLVATVAAISPDGPNASFTITGQSQTGTCRATFQGAAGAKAGVAIIIAPPGITIDHAPNR